MDDALNARFGIDAEIAAINRGTPARLAVLDSVRGLAAMIVVIHHCFLTQPAFSDFFFSIWQTPARNLLQYVLFYTPARIVWDGYEAVTLFYVLSGLVLTLPWVERRSPTYISFSIKRIARIYFPYYVAILAAAALNAAFLPWADVPGASNWVTGMTWTNPVTAWTFVDHAIMYGHRISVNGAIHSLIWEMRVSLLFPILILPIVRFRAGGAAAVVASLVAFIIVLQLAVSGGFDAVNVGFNGEYALLGSDAEHGILGKIAYEVQWTAYYACFFVAGSLVALYLQPIRRWLASIPAWARLTLLVSGLLVFQEHWSRIHALQETMVAVGSVIVIVAALSAGSIERVLLCRPFQFLGRISYSLYLVHVPLILTAVILLQAVPLWALLIIIPPAAILLGWLFHITISAPCARLGQRVAKQFEHRRVVAPSSLNIAESH